MRAATFVYLVAVFRRGMPLTPTRRGVSPRTHTAARIHQPKVVLGEGSVGALLSAHSEVKKVSFTGSRETGALVSIAAAPTFKKVTMELGGKSPLLIFADADLENAVSAAMIGNWYSNGEVCSNGTRVFVEESIKDAFVAKIVERTLKLKIGGNLDPETEISALVSKQHMEKVLGYVVRLCLPLHAYLC